MTTANMKKEKHIGIWAVKMLIFNFKLKCQISIFFLKTHTLTVTQRLNSNESPLSLLHSCQHRLASR